MRMSSTTRIAAWLCAALAIHSAAAQMATNDVPPESAVAWQFSAAVAAYFVPNSREYVQPTFTVDRDWLHLEGRYNYEDLETGSVWLGWNLGGGDAFAWEMTPMVGGVFGNTTGVAPGYKASLSWWRLELYSEGEYLFDTDDSSDSFFYTWSELSLSPWEWLRFGLAAQRTHLYDTDREIQRGLLAGFSYKLASLTAYVFNLDQSRPTTVLSLNVNL